MRIWNGGDKNNRERGRQRTTMIRGVREWRRGERHWHSRRNEERSLHTGWSLEDHLVEIMTTLMSP